MKVLHVAGAHHGGIQCAAGSSKVTRVACPAFYNEVKKFQHYDTHGQGWCPKYWLGATHQVIEVIDERPVPGVLRLRQAVTMMVVGVHCEPCLCQLPVHCMSWMGHHEGHEWLTCKYTSTGNQGLYISTVVRIPWTHAQSLYADLSHSARCAPHSHGAKPQQPMAWIADQGCTL